MYFKKTASALVLVALLAGCASKRAYPMPSANVVQEPERVVTKIEYVYIPMQEDCGEKEEVK